MQPITNLRPDNQNFISCPKCSGTILERKRYIRAYEEPASKKPVEHHALDLYMCVVCNTPILDSVPGELSKKSIAAEAWPEQNLKDLLFKIKKIDMNTLTDRMRKFLNRPSTGSMQSLKGLKKYDTSNTDSE